MLSVFVVDFLYWKPQQSHLYYLICQYFIHNNYDKHRINYDSNDTHNGRIWRHCICSESNIIHRSFSPNSINCSNNLLLQYSFQQAQNVITYTQTGLWAGKNTLRLFVWYVPSLKINNNCKLRFENKQTSNQQYKH